MDEERVSKNEKYLSKFSINSINEFLN